MNIIEATENPISAFLPPREKKTKVYEMRLSKLATLFVDLHKNPEHYLASEKTKEFKEKIETKLDELEELEFSLSNERDGEEKDFQYFEKKFTGRRPYDRPGLPRHTSRYDFAEDDIEQSQGPWTAPDFLLQGRRKPIGIDVKFSKGRQCKPAWNSKLPRPDRIYIFGARQRKEITFFAGRDVIAPEEAHELHAIFMELRALQRKFNAHKMDNQRYGFSANIRMAFEQTQIYNRGAIIDFFENRDREELESSAIRFLREHTRA